ncbi:hypothetical protein [Enterococcus sp. AZ072]|uniref:hypothetical protein n=1 Tax=unclassified Enterococcus TaxID=2608891 RepID=UPI003D2712A5
MTKEQQAIIDEIERTVELGIFTPMKAIVRYISFYQGGAYETLDEAAASQVLKELVNKNL